MAPCDRPIEDSKRNILVEHMSYKYSGYQLLKCKMLKDAGMVVPKINETR